MLNEEQKQAIIDIQNSLLILAGPQTGKTMLVTKKINYLILKKNYKTNTILTISNNPNSQEKISEQVLLKSKKQYSAKSFQNFSKELIEKYHKYIPKISKNYKIINKNIGLIFFYQNIKKFNISSIKIQNNTLPIVSDIQNAIINLKKDNVDLIKLQAIQTDNVQTKMDIVSAYLQYEIWKKDNNFIDKQDLDILVLELLQSEQTKEIQKEIKAQYKYILIDDAEDLTKTQLAIIQEITTNNNNTNITMTYNSNLSETIPNCLKNYKIINLNQVYDMSEQNVDMLNKLISNHKNKLQSVSTDTKGDSNNNKSSKTTTTNNVKLIEITSNNAQNTYLANQINDIMTKESNVKIGILFRNQLDLKDTSNFFNKLSIEHCAINKQCLFEHPIIQSILSILKIIKNPKETNKELFDLLCNTSIRDETVRKISRASKLKEKAIYNVLSNTKGDISEYKDENPIIQNLYENIAKLIEKKQSHTSLYDIVRDAIFDFNFYQKEIIADNKENIFAMNSFILFVEDYSRMYKSQSVEDFLDYCQISEELSLPMISNHQNLLQIKSNISEQLKYSKQSQVTLVNVTEKNIDTFDYIFIPYLNDRKFPANFRRSKFELFGFSNKDDFIEDEKQLLFTAMSRVKKGLCLSYSKENSSKISELIEELDITSEAKFKYSVEFNDLETNLVTSEEVKLEIIKKVENFLLLDKFDKAKSEIDLLKGLFGKRDLTSFIANSNHENYDYYNDKINNNNSKNPEPEKENLDIDTSKFVYSVSQLKTYESCPRKYLYQYIYSIPTECKHYFDFGTSVHEVFEHLILEIKKYPKEVLFARAVADLSKIWISKGYQNEVQEKEYYEKAIEAIKFFIDRQTEMQKDGRETVGIEEKFIFEIEGKRVLGFIDRIDKVDGEYEILDYKTSKSMETPEQLRSNLQLFVYSLALKELYNKYPKAVGLWYVIHDKLALVNFEDIDMDKSRKKMLSLIESIERKDFNAIPTNFGCRFCDFNKLCKDSIWKG